MPAGRFWRRYRVWIALAAVAVVAIAAYVIYQRSQPTQATTTYTTTKAETGTLSVTVSGSGNLAVRNQVEVNAKTSGTIADIRVDKGDKVSKGDVLFTLDGATARENTVRALASLRQAKQSLKNANISLMQARDDLQDLESRTGTAAATEDEIDIAEAKVASAKLGVSSAKASLTSAELAYEDAAAAEGDLTVRAPVGGTIWTVNVAEGDTVGGGSSSSGSGSSGSSSSGSSGSSSASNAPVVIAEDGELAVQLSINEVDLPSLKVGQAAEVVFDALPDLTLTGKVDEIDREGTVSSGVVTYSVWVKLDVGDKRLASGMSAQATIVTDVARDVLLVPNAAVKTNTDGTSYVQVLQAGATTPTQVTVEIGLQGSSQTQILSGITEGTPVVTKTNEASTSSSGSSGGGRGGFIFGGGPRD